MSLFAAFITLCFASVSYAGNPNAQLTQEELQQTARAAALANQMNSTVTTTTVAPLVPCPGPSTPAPSPSSSPSPSPDAWKSCVSGVTVTKTIDGKTVSFQVPHQSEGRHKKVKSNGTLDDSGQFVIGKGSTFGGPFDPGLKKIYTQNGHPYIIEKGALTGENLASVGDRYTPEKDYYCAMRWDYFFKSRVSNKKLLANLKILVRNPKTGRMIVCRANDFGPGLSTKKAIDLSPSALLDLMVDHNQGNKNLTLVADHSWVLNPKNPNILDATVNVGKTIGHILAFPFSGKMQNVPSGVKLNSDGSVNSVNEGELDQLQITIASDDAPLGPLAPESSCSQTPSAIRPTQTAVTQAEPTLPKVSEVVLPEPSAKETAAEQISTPTTPKTIVPKPSAPVVEINPPQSSVIDEFESGGGYSSHMNLKALKTAVNTGDGSLSVSVPHVPMYGAEATYLAFLKTLEDKQNSGSLKLSQAALSALKPSAQDDGHGIWGRWNANGPGTARFFATSGIGENFVGMDKIGKARSGDFLKFFLTDKIGKNEKGLSAIYLGTGTCENPDNLGKTCMLYWSSQSDGISPGIGRKEIPLDQVRNPVFSRLEHPEKLNDPSVLKKLGHPDTDLESLSSENSWSADDLNNSLINQ